MSTKNIDYAPRRRNKNKKHTNHPSSTTPSHTTRTHSSKPSETSGMGASDPPSPASIIWQPGYLESQQKLHVKPPVASYWQRLWWSKWSPHRVCTWMTDLFVALYHLMTGQHWLDGLYSLLLLVSVLFACSTAIDALLHIFKAVAAQDADCSVVYVTIPGPIVTVSLVGQTPKDPNHGTYYYSVVNGTTQWLDSVAPPTRSSTLATTLSEFTPTATSPIPTSAPAMSPPVIPPTTATFATRPSSVGSQPSLPSYPVPPPVGPPGTPSSNPPPGATSLSTSTTIPPGVTISSLPSKGTQTEQSPSFAPTSAPPPVVLTSTLRGSGGASTVTVTLSNGPNLPSNSNSNGRPDPSSGAQVSSVTTVMPPNQSGILNTLPGTTLSAPVPPESPPSALPPSTPPQLSSTVLSGGLPSPPIPTSTPGPLPGASYSSAPNMSPILPSDGSPSPSSIIFPTPISHAPTLAPSNTDSTRFTVSLPRPSSEDSSRASSTRVSPGSSNASSSTSISSTVSSMVTSSGSISTTASPTSGSSQTVTSLAGIITTSTTLRSTLGTLSSVTTVSISSGTIASLLTSATSAVAPSSTSTTLTLSTTSTVPLSSVSETATTTTSPVIISPSMPAFVNTTRSANTTTFSSSQRTSVSSSSPLSRPVPSSSWNSTQAAEMTTGSMVTKVLAYADTQFSFVFPKPNITTTVSYWTGTYPSITGPDWTELPLTTRTLGQTLLSGLQPSASELPSFQLLSSSQQTPPLSEAPSGLPSSAASSRRLTTLQTVIITTIIIGGDDEDAAAATATQTETKLIAARAGEEDPGPTSCGESGNFTLTFDDSTVAGDDSDVLPVVGMNNPYHHLFYANGFAYLPDKWEPYAAVSQPNVAMFLPIGSNLLPNTGFAGTLLPGEFGAGPRASVDAYWFNARSGYFGCALNGVTACTLRISGYRYDTAVKGEVLVAEQNVTIPPCWGYINCQLTQVAFNEDFQALSGIQFNAFTYELGIPQVFMMDDVEMDWYNNSCSAGILRIGHSFGPGT